MLFIPHLLITAVVAIAISLSGCSNPVVQQAGGIAVDCATVDIGKTLPDIGTTIFQDVLQIVSAGSDGWLNALEQLGIKYGEDALACAAKAVSDALTAHPVGAAAGPPPPAAIRASQLIQKHQWVFKGASR